MKYNLVYFDDQIQNLECYQALLKDKFNVVGCNDTKNYAEVLKANRPHALMVDLHMPEVDGIELFKLIQDSDHYNGCPIFFISGDISTESRLKTYQTGGIDFFERNLKHEEITARLENKIRLFLQGANVLELGNLKLDTNSYIAQINYKNVDLTLLEMRLLGLILRSPSFVISKKELIERIWDSETKEGKVYVHLSNLGQKLWSWNHQIKVKGDVVSIVAL
jgi:DNA-binding response OmpR family regulator